MHRASVVAASIMCCCALTPSLAQENWGRSGVLAWPARPTSPRVFEPRINRPPPLRQRVARVAPAAPAVMPSAVAGDRLITQRAAAQAQPNTPPSPLLAVVSLRDQSISIWGEEGLVLQSKVSTGQSRHPTPTGIFSVVQKRRMHHSNIYSNAPMPFMQRITWSGIALHAGVLPGYPASHGCIRLPRDVAERLFAMTRIGMRVVIVPDDAVPFEFEHEGLPRPRLEPADVVVAQIEQIQPAPSPVPAISDVDVNVRISTTAAVEPIPPANRGRLLDPFETALKRKATAASAVRSKAQAAREALAHAAVKSAEANAAVANMRRGASELREAEAEQRAISASTGAIDETVVARTAARVAAAQTQYQTAVADEAIKTPVAFVAARAARVAEVAADEAPDVAKEAARGLAPVSVFISRKAGRVFVRQGFEAVLDAAVAIEQPELPLGTHVFTVMSSSETDRSRLRWTALTLESGSRQSAPVALARIAIPAGVREEIEKRLFAGASLIVSDFGLSNETGSATDFVVLTK